MSLNTVTEEQDMSNKCVVPGCKRLNRSQKSTSIMTYFPVPSNKRMLKKWQDAIPGQVELMKGQKICSQHFQKSDLIRAKDMNRVGPRKGPRIRCILSKNAIPYFFPDETTHFGSWKKNKSDPLRKEKRNTNCDYYDALTLNPFFGCIKTSLKPRRNEALNVLNQNQTSSLEITLNEESVCHTSLHTGNNPTQEIAPKSECEPSVDMSDSESNFPDIDQDISISDLRENIRNELKEYERCRKDLEQSIEQNMDLETNCNISKFTFHKLLQGTISIKIPPNWYKIIPSSINKAVVFANFVLRSDQRDQMLVSFKSVCIGEDGIAKCSILDKELDFFPGEYITSSQQLESIIIKLDNLLVCKGVILGKDFAYSYSQTCYLDKQGHWRHVTCSLSTVRGYETCISCTKVLPILLQLKNTKGPGRKGKFEFI